MAEIRKTFAVPPEVTRYFEGKAAAPAFSWLDVWAEEHAYKFTVAKATELEVLTSFRSTISQAIAEGKGFDSWKPLIEKELSKLGWWGPRMVSDPTGEQPDRMVNFASDRRLKTIFWSNANSARSAGQWERVQRTKAALPYILYVRTTSADPRPEHLSWVGIILPVDHPFWQTHWPPNGWLCKCQVRQISKREAERLLGRKPEDGGILYRDSVPDLGPDIQHRNRRTGEVTMVPPGIDPGWHTNPGLARASTLVENLEARLAAAVEEDATKALNDLWADPYLKIAPRLPQEVTLPVGHNANLAEQLGARSPVISMTSGRIAERIEAKLPVEDLAVLPELLSQGEIHAPAEGDPARARTMIGRIGRTLWRSIVSLSESGYLRATTLDKVSEE